MNNTAHTKQTAGTPVLLSTNSFVLSSLGASHVTPELLAWFNRKELLDGLNLPIKQFTLESLRSMLATFDNINHFLIGIYSPTNQLLGFYAIDINHLHKTGNITAGIGANTGYTGRKIFWSTIDALLGYFFQQKGLDKMIARVLANNIRMLSCLIGSPDFALEACLHKECIGVDGKRVDLLIFSAFKDPKDFQIVKDRQPK